MRSLPPPTTSHEPALPNERALLALVIAAMAVVFPLMAIPFGYVEHDGVVRLHEIGLLLLLILGGIPMIWGLDRLARDRDHPLLWLVVSLLVGGLCAFAYFFVMAGLPHAICACIPA